MIARSNREARLRIDKSDPSFGVHWAITASPATPVSLHNRTPHASFSSQMVAHKLSVYVLSILFLGLRFGVFAADIQGVPLPENTSIVLAVAAEGVQIYQSKPNSTGAYEWAFKAPEAELKSLTGEVLGKHFAGPSWS